MGIWALACTAVLEPRTLPYMVTIILSISYEGRIESGRVKCTGNG